jgi:hypothetical protein
MSVIVGDGELQGLCDFSIQVENELREIDRKGTNGCN